MSVLGLSAVKNLRFDGGKGIGGAAGAGAAGVAGARCGCVGPTRGALRTRARPRRERASR